LCRRPEAAAKVCADFEDALQTWAISTMLESGGMEQALAVAQVLVAYHLHQHAMWCQRRTAG
jgi:hypothetical protein